LSEKGQELFDKIKSEISKLEDTESLKGKFLNFWRIACIGKQSSFDKAQRYDDSSKEFVEKYKDQLTKMRGDFVENIDFYVEKAIKSMEKNGMRVYYAKTNEEAHKIFMEELGEVKVVYKSKSNEAKDIGILDVLIENNITIKETDLGDVFVQMFDYKLPTYQVGPGVHFDVEDIVEKIKEVYGAEVEPKPSEIVRFFRETYRKELLNDVKVSLTSANAISAEDGSIVLLENEGNISLITRATEKHIVLVGITKIVPTIIDALLVAKMYERINNAEISYISFISGPSSTSDVRGMNVKGMYGAKEVVVILVDDWRTKAAKENLFYKDILKCIGCKTCNFVCTASRAFGNIYASKYGLGALAILKDYIHNGLESAIADGLFLCTGCENCHNWCPVDVNLAEIMKCIKKEATDKGLCPPSLKKYQEKILKDKNPFE
jgi:L-lactate utilization protein LutB